MTTVRIPPVYMKTRSLLCSCVQLNVHSDCLVYNNTKRLLQYFITSTCPLQRVQTRSLSHLTSHSRDGSHLGSQDPNSHALSPPRSPLRSSPSRRVPDHSSFACAIVIGAELPPLTCDRTISSGGDVLAPPTRRLNATGPKLVT